MGHTLTGFKQDRVGAYIEKDPFAVLDYTLDWSNWMPSGEVISSATVNDVTIIDTITAGQLLASGNVVSNAPSTVESESIVASSTATTREKVRQSSRGNRRAMGYLLFWGLSNLGFCATL